MSKILAAHKEGGPKAGTGMTVESLQSALDKKIIEYITKFDFNTSGAGKLMYTLVKFSVFLQSQQAPKLVNDSLLKTIKELSESTENGQAAVKFKKFLHLYLSFATQLCYHKPIQEALDQEYHDLMPNQD